MAPGKPAVGFIVIPLEILRDPNLSPSAKLVYGRLKLYAGKDGRCFMKHETLAAEVCLGGRQLRTVLTELKSAGWIDWRRGRTSCHYTVHSVRQKTADQDRQKSASVSGGKPPVRSAENCRQKRRSENHHRKQDPEERTHSPLEESTPGKASPKKHDLEPEIFDDDSSRQFPLEAPEDEIKRLAAKRGDPLSERDWWDIKALAETRGIALAELAALARKNNGDWRNSAAGLKWLIRNYRVKATPVEVSAAPDPGVPQGGTNGRRCSLCGGLGRQSDGDYCRCPMGRDLRTADEGLRKEREKNAALAMSAEHAVLVSPNHNKGFALLHLVRDAGCQRGAC